MPEKIRFTERSEIEFQPAEVPDVHLEDLEFVLDVERDGEEVRSCTIDVHELVQVMVLHSSMEKHRYDWRK